MSAGGGPVLAGVSLVVPTRGRARYLLDTVASVLGGDRVPAELLVVDQSDRPSDGLVDRVERGCRVRYLWRPGRGLSRALNLGIDAAEHDVLAFTHDDVLVTPEWLAALVDALREAGPAAVVTGRVLAGAPERAGGVVPTLKEDPRPATYAGRVGEDVLFPLNMAMHRDAVRRVGLFDERLGPGTFFPGAEDNDFGLRLLEAGLSILYRPEAALYHRAWRADYMSLRFDYGRGQGAFYAKHLDLRDRYMLRRLLAECRGGVGGVVRGRAARGNLAYLGGMLVGALGWAFHEVSGRRATRHPIA